MKIVLTFPLSVLPTRAARVLSVAALAVPVCLALGVPQPAHGQVRPGDSARFSMQSVDGGLMKLDTRTGAMTFCSQRSGAWVCEAVPEDRAALEAEIARLQSRLAAERGGAAGPGVPDIMSTPEAQAPAGEGTTRPSETTPPASSGETVEEARRRLDQAMEMAEHVFQRFFEMIGRLRDTPPPPANPHEQSL